MELNKEVSWLGARLREPSSYAGMAAVAAALGMAIDPTLGKALMSLGVGLGGLIAFFMPEAK